MSYTTVTDLRTMTGTDLGDGEMNAIIALADKEVDAYLAVYGLSGSTDPAISTASLKLSTVILYQRCHTPEHDPAIGQLTKTAYTLLDEYIRKQTTLPNNHSIYVKKVN
jgi:hypothetical protein